MDNDTRIIHLPDDALPDIEELTGHLREVAEIVGIKKALVLGQVFHSVPIRLWNCQKLLRRFRDDCIRKEYEAGATGEYLAKRFNLSDRQIWNILGRPQQEEDNKQQSLF